jgi:hypothetical protein
MFGDKPPGKTIVFAGHPHTGSAYTGEEVSAHSGSLATNQDPTKISGTCTVSRNAMATKITTDMLESYLQCRYKSHLKLSGEQGTPSDYERLLQEAREHIHLAATDKLLSQCGASEILRNLPLTPAVLKRGVPFVLDAIVEDEGLSIRFDALQRVSGPSRVGDFHYIPVLFHGAERFSPA